MQFSEELDISSLPILIVKGFNRSDRYFLPSRTCIRSLQENLVTGYVTDFSGDEIDAREIEVRIKGNLLPWLVERAGSDNLPAS